METGRPPFQASSPMDTLSQVSENEPVPPRQLNESVPRDLETIALKCLQKDPKRRYGSARELAEDLDRYLAGQPILARPVGRAERLWRWCRRNPGLAGMTAALLLLLLSTAVISTWSAYQLSTGARQLSLARDAADRGRAEAQERLYESLIAQGRSQRVSGARWAALDALGAAARIQPTEDLRQEAVETLTAPGVRLRQVIPFGEAFIVRFSSDGTLIAIDGHHQGDQRDQGDGYQRVVYRVADVAVEVDRIELGESESGSSAMGRFVFRPGSTTLAYEDHRDDHRGLRLRDVAQGKDIGFFPGATIGAFSPDGSRLVLRQDDRLRVVNADSMREEHSRPAAGILSFVANDELLIEEGRQLKGWDVRTGRETFIFTTPQGRIRGSDTNGSLIEFAELTDAPAATITMWDVRTGKEVARLEDVAFDPGRGGLRRTAPGSLLAFDVQSRPGEILLYDLVRQAPRGRLDGVIATWGSLTTEQRSALSPTGRLLAAYARLNDLTIPQTIHVWDVETGQKIATLRDCKIPIWSADGRHLATIAPGSFQGVQQVQTFPDGSKMTTGIGGPEALVKIWEVADPTPTYRQDRPIQAISTSPDGRRLAVDDQLWEVVSASGMSPAHLRPLPRPVPADLITYTGSGVLYAMRLHKADRFKDFDQPTPLWQLEPQHRELGLPTIEPSGDRRYRYFREPELVAFSPDGWLAAGLWQSGATNENGTHIIGAGYEIDVWDLATPRLIHILKHRDEVRFHGDDDDSVDPPGDQLTPYLGGPRQFVFSGDSRKLAIACLTGVVIYDVSSGKPVRWLAQYRVTTRDGQGTHTESGSAPANCVTFTPNGQWVCYGGGGRLFIGSLEPAPDERPTFLVRPPGDNDLKLAEGESKITWEGHKGAVLAMAISPDGRTLASGGDDRMIHLWEVPTGRPLARWQAHDAHVTALAFRPDGRTLVSGAADGMLKLWDLASIRSELAGMGLDW
jgi:WD40 repeat protein